MLNSTYFQFNYFCFVSTFTPIPSKCQRRSARVPRPLRLFLRAIRSKEINYRVTTRWYCKEGVFQANSVCFLLVGLHNGFRTARFKANDVGVISISNAIFQDDKDRIFLLFIYRRSKDKGIRAARLTRRRPNGTRTVNCFNRNRFNLVRFCFSKRSIYFNNGTFNGRFIGITIRLLRWFRVAFYRLLFVNGKRCLPVYLIYARSCFLRANIILLTNRLFNMFNGFIMNACLTTRVWKLNRNRYTHVRITNIYAGNIGRKLTYAIRNACRTLSWDQRLTYRF